MLAPVMAVYAPSTQRTTRTRWPQTRCEARVAAADRCRRQQLQSSDQDGFHWWRLLRQPAHICSMRGHAAGGHELACAHAPRPSRLWCMQWRRAHPAAASTNGLSVDCLHRSAVGVHEAQFARVRRQPGFAAGWLACVMDSTESECFRHVVGRKANMRHSAKG